MTDSDWFARRSALETLMGHRVRGTFSGMGGSGDDTIARLANALYGVQQKRRVFVSYHHGGDRSYYEMFRNTLCGQFDVVHDNSPDREIDSDDAEYVLRRLREHHITGSSCTIVLVGQETWGRRYVDWEIEATLDKQHGLIAVRLPSLSPHFAMPWRLFDNIQSGYAIWADWAQLMLNPINLRHFIEQAKAKPKSLINNARPRRCRSE